MKFLIVKTSSLGDIIHTFPCVAFLKDRFPTAQVDWVVEKRFSDIVMANPLLNHVYCIDTHRWRKTFFSLSTWKEIKNISFPNNYDAVFDLQGNSKSAFVLWKTKAKVKVGFGWKTVFEYPNLLFTHKRFNPPKEMNVREENLFLLRSYFSDFAPFKTELAFLDHKKGEKKKILICPGSAWYNKQLTCKTLCQFMQLLKDHLNPHFYLVWGNEKEKRDAQLIHQEFQNCSTIVDKKPLSEIKTLMHQMDLIIAVDSVLLHLAGLTSTPTFSIFGASAASKYKPEGERHFAYQGKCPYGRSIERRCPILRTCKTGACIHDLSAQDLFKAFQIWY